MHTIPVRSRRWRAAAIGAVVAVLMSTTTPAHAQLVVTDPGALVKLLIEIEQVGAQYDTLQATYRQWLAIVARLPGIDRYNIPPYVPLRHDIGRYPYAAPMLQGLNSGDPSGALYEKVVSAIPLAQQTIDRLPVGSQARTVLEHDLAAIQITDSIVERGIHQVGSYRSWNPAVMKSIANLIQDVIAARTAYHYPAAILDKISGAEVISADQRMIANELKSHQLEQAILDAKAQRDADADTMNLRLADIQDGRAAGAAMISGTGDAIRAWRQP